MRINRKRLLMSNVLIVSIIAIAYFLSFNNGVQTAITSAYTNAVYRGEKQPDAIGVMILVDNDLNNIYKAKEYADEIDAEFSYMISSQLIKNNETKIEELCNNGYEIGIFGTQGKGYFESLSILRRLLSKDILYVQKKQQIDREIFSNSVVVVVYSIDANIAYKQFSDDFCGFIQPSTFVAISYTTDEEVKSIIEALNNNGFNIEKLGDMF